MNLKLKEDPKEWRRFTFVMAILVGGTSIWLRVRNDLSQTGMGLVLAGLAIALALAWRRPRWFRPFYRAGMTASFHLGQVMGKMLLAVFFLLVLTPMGLALRMLGKDLLQLKRKPGATTYWHPAKPSSRFDQQF